jgi:hypothetical protein
MKLELWEQLMHSQNLITSIPYKLYRDMILKACSPDLWCMPTRDGGDLEAG